MEDYREPPPEPAEDLFSGKFSTEAALQRIRKRLLDLSIRNGLLNYRFPKRRALRIIDTPINPLFERLYFDAKQCPVIPVPDPNLSEYEFVDDTKRKPDVRKHAQSVGLNVEYELPEFTNRQPSNDIQSLQYRDDLERVIRDLDQFTRTSLEESGANILYLVLGYLSWREAESSQKDLLAPLIILPVALKRTGVDPRGYFRYSLEYTGEDLTDNITLREKLRADFNLELPLLGEDDSPEDYFAKIDEFVKYKREWKVHRFATLCLLSFGKLLMYLDLDKKRWPQSKPIHDNPLVSSLFKGETDYQGDTFAPEYDVDNGYDLPLIYDADSSQHSAVVDAIKGKNLVIEGPPGTGKSQTITNLIASALTEGKTVLFVSDKLAALEVVKRRLDTAGLGAFCLEFHSHKTQKRKLLDEIKFRMDQNFYPPIGLERKLSDLSNAKKALTNYVTFMNSVTGNKLGLTVHEVLWASDRYRSQIHENFGAWTAEFSFAASVESLSEYEESLEQLQRHLIASGSYGSNNPWWGYLPGLLLFGDETTVEHILSDLKQVANELDNYISSSEQSLGIRFPREEQSLRKLCTKLALQLFVPDDDLALDLLPELTLETSHTTLENLAKTVRFILDTEPTVIASFRNPETITAANINELHSAGKMALGLGQHEVMATLIVERLAELQQANLHLERAVQLFDECVKACNLQLAPTPSNFALLRKILGIASMAPVDLLDFRSDHFQESGVRKKLRNARARANQLQDQKLDLQRVFDLQLLPPRDELATALRTLKTQRGVFRFFNREWWKARRLYYSLIVKPTRVSSDTQIETLSSLLTFVNESSAFQSDPELHRVFGPLFIGMETNWDDLERLIEWYLKIESHLRPHFLPGDPLDLVHVVVNLTKTTLAWLSSQYTQFNLDCAWLEDFGHNLTDIVSVEFQGSSLSMSPDTLLNQFAEQLRTHSEDFRSIASCIQSNFQTDESPYSSVHLISKLIALRSARQELHNLGLKCSWMGRWYQGIATDLEAISATRDWAEAIAKINLPDDIQRWLLTPDAATRAQTLVSVAETVVDQWGDIDNLLSKLKRFGDLNLNQWYRGKQVNAELIKERATEALDAIDLLVTWADLSRAIERTTKLGLKPVCDPILQGLVNPDQLIPALRYVFYSSIGRSLFREHPKLMQFSGLSHQQIKDKFQALDQEILILNRKKCAVDISKRPVPMGVGSGYVRNYSDRYLLDNEIRKKKRHIPIRQLVKRAGGALQALKPCFMMSPLSVAQYLEPGMRTFDLVVFDEASQVKPEDSIGAIARGSQIVIVGDPKQLPPTSFFDTVMDDSDDDEEVTALDESESILDVSQTKFQPARRLRWHYRSQHHSLIHFSNSYFYNDRPLFVFPSPFEAQDGLGIHWHYVSNGVYENRQNGVEAVKVIDAVFAHIKKYPKESLGVVTLNGPQRNLIQDEFDKRLKSDLRVEGYLNTWKNDGEPFFIKNLENVQGDERDAIIISATYGKNKQGAFYQRFGPITSATGWRRLNVLFTRAKRRIELFSSMESEEIRIDGTTSRGVQALKNYLTFAKTGNLESIEVSSREADSDFEISVGTVLRNNGYQIVPQLGVAGFFIDIAVRHPDRTGEFLLAIECDGATYHSTKSARDRDRLRQEILEKLGWKNRIYRIWSADWFKDPKTQTKRLLEFLQNALQKSREESPVTTYVEEEVEKAADESSQSISLTSPTEPFSLDDSFVQVWDYVTFTYLDDPSNHKSVQIVKGQTDVETGVVGDKMPLARALLGAAIGEQVELSLPGRPTRQLEVISIER